MTDLFAIQETSLAVLRGGGGIELFVYLYSGRRGGGHNRFQYTHPLVLRGFANSRGHIKNKNMSLGSFCSLRDHPSYLCCPDAQYGKRVWFTESHIVLITVFSLMLYLFILFLI